MSFSKTNQPKRQEAAPVLLSDSIPAGPMHLSGIVKTTNGYAVVTAELDKHGKVVAWKIGKSQAYPEFVAIEHKRIAAHLSQKAQGAIK